MRTATCLPPATLSPHKPWLRRVLADLAARWQRAAPLADEALYADLAHLSEETLRDIGAPDWLHASDRGALLWQLERVRW